MVPVANVIPKFYTKVSLLGQLAYRILGHRYTVHFCFGHFAYLVGIQRIQVYRRPPRRVSVTCRRRGHFLLWREFQNSRSSFFGTYFTNITLCKL